MSTQEKLKKAFHRTTNAMQKKPSLGRLTCVSSTSIEGLTCTISEGEWNLKADMPVQAGGNGDHPTPSVLGRAALGSCLAIGYMLRASVKGVPIRSLKVEIHADSDNSGLYGNTEVLPGYHEVRYLIKIDSPATEEEILSILDEGDQFSPWLDNFRRPVSSHRSVEIINTIEDRDTETSK